MIVTNVGFLQTTWWMVMMHWKSCDIVLVQLITMCQTREKKTVNKVIYRHIKCITKSLHIWYLSRIAVCHVFNKVD